MFHIFPPQILWYYFLWFSSDIGSCDNGLEISLFPPRNFLFQIIIQFFLIYDNYSVVKLLSKRIRNEADSFHIFSMLEKISSVNQNSDKNFRCLGRPHFLYDEWNQAWYRNWFTSGCFGNSKTKISFYGNQSRKLDSYNDVINCLLTSDGWEESGVILKPRRKGVDKCNGISESGVLYKGNIVGEIIAAWVNNWGLYLAVDFLSRYVLEKRILLWITLSIRKYNTLIFDLHFWFIKTVA